jgi:ferredoxin
MKKVWIDEGCIACGLSEGICPEVFQLKEKETLIQGINYSDYKEKIKEAAEFCPVNAIKYTE